MLDHISLGIVNLNRARKFYDLALKPLGITMVYPAPGYGFGYGAKIGEPKFWIGSPLAKRRKAKACAGSHIAFVAANRKAVDAFYKAAIKAGGKDNGKPGLRPEYHANYYGAFVYDPEGHAIEACCHNPE
jgi:catechol 2,3-dioxygenase-like lactoylglutathione lyase family enzyme